MLYAFLRRRLSDKRGFELTDIVAVTVMGGIAAAVMTPVMTRTLQGQTKGGMDAMAAVKGTGELSNFKPLAQYEPYTQKQDYETERKDSYSESYAKGKITRTGNLTDVARTGSETRGGADKMDSDNTWK